MTHEGFEQPPDAEIAEAFSGAAFLAEHGLVDIADDMIEAHGGRFTVAEAIEGCRPLADMVVSLSRDLKDVPGHMGIIKNAIQSAGGSTAERPVPEAAKKKLK
ncbi:MAG: hypothetical protein JWS12_523 [Candidatus Saccharibacteria bacterium]|nr:hypothetical protein [Candidatus Saccharibacteria bacterium]